MPAKVEAQNSHTAPIAARSRRSTRTALVPIVRPIVSLATHGTTPQRPGGCTSRADLRRDRQSAMNMPAVHYGSLAVPRSAKALVDSAFAYLSRDAVERSLIRRVEHSRIPHRIVTDRRGDDSYQPDTHTIRWDPTSALRTSGHGRQSPALGLGHELDHAAMSDRAFDLLVAIPDPRFDNLEE